MTFRQVVDLRDPRAIKYIVTPVCDGRNPIQPVLKHLLAVVASPRLITLNEHALDIELKGVSPWFSSS